MPRHSLSTLSLGLVAVLCGLPLSAQAVSLATPSLGSVLQQVTPPLPLPEVPGAVLRVPKPSQQKSHSTIQIPVRRLVVTGNHLIATARLHALVQGAEGRTLTLDRLNAVVNRITIAYQNAGYPLAYAYLPAQTVRHGVIRIAVVEPTFDQVKVTGTSRFRAAQVRRVAHIRSGQVVETKALSRALLLLNQTPGVQIKGTLIPGAAPRTSTLEVSRHDLPVLSGTLGIDNTGNPLTGQVLMTATASANDPFGYGSSLSANAVGSTDGNLSAHGVTLISPDYGNGLHFGAYGSASSYLLGGSFASLHETGAASQVGLDVTYPLILQPGRVLSLRGDLLQSWSTQSAAGARISALSIPLARLTLSGASVGRGGAVTTARLSLSHGRVTFADAAAAASDAAGPQTAGAFDKLSFALGRRQAIGQGFRLSLSLSGQLASRNLDSSQQFFIGGASGVMSTPSGSIGGDDGYLADLRLSHRLAAPALPGRLTASLLGQFGGVWTRHSPYASFSGQRYLSKGGIGVGLSYAWRRLTLEARIVTPVGGTAPASIVPAAGQAWLTASVSF